MRTTVGDGSIRGRRYVKMVKLLISEVVSYDLYFRAWLAVVRRAPESFYKTGGKIIWASLRALTAEVSGEEAPAAAALDKGKDGDDKGKDGDDKGGGKIVLDPLNGIIKALHPTFCKYRMDENAINNEVYHITPMLENKKVSATDKPALVVKVCGLPELQILRKNQAVIKYYLGSVEFTEDGESATCARHSQ